MSGQIHKVTILTTPNQNIVGGILARGERSVTNERRKSVVSLLESLKGRPKVEDCHPLRQYISAFESYPIPATRLIDTGGDSIVIELADGNVLKITNRSIVGPLGKRPFDLPTLESGTRRSETGLAISYLVQPMAQCPVSTAAMRQFRRTLADCGYSMIDGGINQVGMYDGEPKLLDVFAVTRTP